MTSRAGTPSSTSVINNNGLSDSVVPPVSAAFAPCTVGATATA